MPHHLILQNKIFFTGGQAKLKNRFILLAIFALSIFIFTNACKIVKTGRNDVEDVPITDAQASNVVTQQPEPFDISPTPTPATAIPSSNPMPSRTELTQPELDFFTEYFGRVENNGFLLSEYDSPEYIDLYEVFYTGAGIDPESISDEELNDYLNAIDASEVYTDLLKLTTVQLNVHLYEKTGLSLNDFAYGLHYLYLEKYDAYYLQRGDTNYNFLECFEGYKTNTGIIVIRCRAVEGYGQAVESCTVTLEKSGGKYLFLANTVEFMY